MLVEQSARKRVSSAEALAPPTPNSSKTQTPITENVKARINTDAVIKKAIGRMGRETTASSSSTSRMGILGICRHRGQLYSRALHPSRRKRLMNNLTH